MRALSAVSFALAISILCTSCSRFSESTSELYVPGSGLLNGRGDGYQLKGVSLTITPASIDLCEHPSGRESTEVAWNTFRSEVQHVDIWVQDGQSRAKRWTTGSTRGSAVTGEWVGNDTTFRMTDTETGKTLALRQVYLSKCLGRT